MTNPESLCPNCLKPTAGEAVCPHCGFDPAKGNPSPFLPLETQLANRYAVGCAVQANGEGVTYLGYDGELQSPVYIREFLPTGLFERSAGSMRVIPVAGNEYAFNTHMIQFLELARGLAQARELSALFPVYDIFEENGTAYYVSEYKENVVLREYLLSHGGSLTWEEARPMFMPVIATLQALHGAGIIHRGISPETLVVTSDGKLWLTGFCVADARQARTSLTAELPQGYAAIEQYGFDGTPGPWTDVYGIGAVLFRTLVGNTPPEATARVTNDKMIVPAAVAQAMPSYLLPALAGALQILPEDRTQSMERLREEISGSPTVAARANQRAEREAEKAKTKKKGEKKYAAVAASITVGVILMIMIAVVLIMSGGDSGRTEEPATDATMFSTEDMSAVQYTTRADDGVSFKLPALKGTSYQEFLSSTDASMVTIRSQLEFVVVRKEYNSAKEGTILEQSPAAGERVKPGDKVELVLSMGSASVSIPSNLVGKERTQAYIALLELGFRPDSIQFISAQAKDMPYNTVIRVEPNAGTAVSRDGVVYVYVNEYVAPKETTAAPSSAGEKGSAAEPTTGGQ